MARRIADPANPRNCGCDAPTLAEHSAYCAEAHNALRAFYIVACEAADAQHLAVWGLKRPPSVGALHALTSAAQILASLRRRIQNAIASLAGPGL